MERVGLREDGKTGLEIHAPAGDTVPKETTLKGKMRWLVGTELETIANPLYRSLWPPSPVTSNHPLPYALLSILYQWQPQRGYLADAEGHAPLVVCGVGNLHPLSQWASLPIFLAGARIPSTARLSFGPSLRPESERGWLQW